MARYTTNYVNLIADNLRDRYQRGLPILKELLQNADDAGAANVVFGYHPGFAATETGHPLLHGPALWMLNDGAFEPRDKQSIQSFGLNAKAADNGAIGKFGLGMKSVFHLCEAFFYVAYDGLGLHHEILSPWFGDTHTAPLHQQWEQTEDRDFEPLAAIARNQETTREARTWFLLWIPLRQRSHLATMNGRKLPGIIDHFPEEDCSGDLDFLSEANLDRRLAVLLPLLRHLTRVRFAGADGAPPFDLQLRLADEESHRLDHHSDELVCAGSVANNDSKVQQLRFFASQKTVCHAPFATLRESESWPKSMAILDSGEWGSVADKTQAEGAVMLAHADQRVGRLVLQWAVFLPTEELRLTYSMPIPDSTREYRIVLHGQFFVDAGRRGIADFEGLSRAHEALPSNAPQQRVLQTWNQALAQEVVLPSLLPTLEAYALANRFRDDELSRLTRAISLCCVEGESTSGFFKTFSAHICRDAAWVRTLSVNGAAWKRVQSGGTRLLPLPPPPTRDPDRPWRTLPGLARLGDVEFVDSTAPALALALSGWDEATLLAVLQDAPVAAFASETTLAWLTEFLSMEKDRYVRTGRVQDALVHLLQKALSQSDLSVLRGNRSHFSSLVSLVDASRRLSIGPQAANAKGAVPEALYRTLARLKTYALLLPRDLAGPLGSEVKAADESDVRVWLNALHGESERLHQGEKMDSDAVEALLRTAGFILDALGDETTRIAFMLTHRAFRVLQATSFKDGRNVAVSLDSLVKIHRQRLLFRNAGPNNQFGHLAEFVDALPGATPVVADSEVVAYVQNDMRSASQRVPASNDIGAMLFSIGARDAAPELADVKTRSALVRLGVSANLATEESVRAMRYLLHGSPARFDSTERLWLQPGGVDSPWFKLWCMVEANHWNAVPRALGNMIPGDLWQKLGLHHFDEETVTKRLRQVTDFAGVQPEAFSNIERNAILGRIQDEAVWKRLPLHLDTAGRFGAVEDDCYLAGGPAPHACIVKSVRLIAVSDDVAHFEQQKRRIRHWDVATAVRLVLEAPQPGMHWRYILEQISSASWLTRTVLPALLTRPWLPLSSGAFIAPERVIRIAGLDSDIATLAKQCGFTYAGVDSLDGEVRASDGFTCLYNLFTSDEAALPALAALMSTAGLSVGRCVLRAPEALLAQVPLLARLTCLPAWSIIERALTHLDQTVVTSKLVKAVAVQLSLHGTGNALAEISELGTHAAVIDLFLCYLEEWRSSEADVDALKAALPSLRLLAQNGHWAPAGTLAADVCGVAPARVLDERQLAILSGVVKRNRDAVPGDASCPASEPGSYDPGALLVALKKLVDPLASGNAADAAGALLGLMGPAARPMAQAWLPLAFKDYIEFLGWKDPGYESGWERRRKLMGGMTPQQALDVVKPVIRFADGGEVEVRSITGAPLRLALVPDDEAQTLLVGELSWQLNYGVVMTFRPTEHLAARDVDDVVRLLQRTTEHLLRHVFNQPHANLDALWASFAKTDQIKLSVARHLVLEGLPASLQQLPHVRRCAALDIALGRVDDARHERASAEAFGRKGDEAEQALRAAIKALGDVVARDNDVQRGILAGIRERIADNQYELSSVPFELFQNADDAVGEFQRLQIAAGRTPLDADTIGRFVFEQEDGVARFLHWGRPVNYKGRGDNVPAQYGSDLERMLMLGATGKGGADGVTGKFGLGFKSVLLATDAPCVWSGDLSFQVVGGCLPQSWMPSSQTRALQARSQGADKSMRTTLTELSLHERATRRELGDRFAALAGLLPVFAREIRHVTVDDETHSWTPRLILEEGGCSVSLGTCRLPVAGGIVTARVLVLRSLHGDMAMRLTSEGVAEFERVEPHPVPAIWVTAPTRGVPARGVVLNAPFQVDTGRASLAAGKAAKRNEIQATDLARKLSVGVVALMRLSQDNWPKCAAMLGCESLTSAAEFWTTFWRAVGLGDLPDDPSADVRLLHAFALELFDSVVDTTDQIPNGFTDADAAFIAPDALRLSVDIASRRAALFAFDSWPSFRHAFPKPTRCTVEVVAWLETAARLDKNVPQVLGRSTLTVLLPGAHLSPEDVVHVATVIDQWSPTTLDALYWRIELANVRLRAEDGSWRSGSQLLRGGSDGDARFSFAPPFARLSPDYAACRDAWSLLRDYLADATLDPATVCDWIISAGSLEARKSAVSWMLRNLYAPAVNLAVSRRFAADWLMNLTPESPELHDLDETSRKIMCTRFGSDATAEKEMPVWLNEYPSLREIQAWWDSEHHGRELEYDRRVWPAYTDRSALLADPVDRSAWMTLFTLGLMCRFGRVTDAQNREFLQYLYAHGWWATICGPSPEFDSEGWMRILQEYGEIQEDTPLFEQWMDLFARLYRMARWLDVYVHIFTTVDLRGPGQTHDLLAPMADALLNGSEIDAPTLRGMLRLGQHLVIRELLRGGRLDSKLARGMAYAPSESMCGMFEALGYQRPGSSEEIHGLLVDELGEEAALFHGAYDIPLRLVASDASVRESVFRFARQQVIDEDKSLTEV
ncbi:hypothetical protein CR51_11860 [Caballeronia megalochromosomata]|nr:hypothetical protein CR51_11860 [Caballeronia megalochromosomata]